MGPPPKQNGKTCLSLSKSTKTPPSIHNNLRRRLLLLFLPVTLLSSIRFSQAPPNSSLSITFLKDSSFFFFLYKSIYIHTSETHFLKEKKKDVRSKHDAMHNSLINSLFSSRFAASLPPPPPSLPFSFF